MTITHRKVCFEYYDRECWICDDSDYIVVHHKDGDAANDSPENLVPLCQSCHKHVHNRNRRSERMSELVDELNRNGTPNFDPHKHEGVPLAASVTVKETCENHKYYYWQWRDGDTIRSKYIQPVDDFQPKNERVGEQTSLDVWEPA